MAEYIFKIEEAVYNEETGEAVMKPKCIGELIHCKDCVFWDESHCWFHTDEWQWFPDDYCSYAERKKE